MHRICVGIKLVKPFPTLTAISTVNTTTTTTITFCSILNAILINIEQTSVGNALSSTHYSAELTEEKRGVLLKNPT